VKGGGQCGWAIPDDMKLKLKIVDYYPQHMLFKSGSDYYLNFTL